MKEGLMKRIILSLLVFICLSSQVFAEINTQEFYKKQLLDSSIEFKVHNFKKAINKNDKKTVELFLKAGMSPDVSFLGRHVIRRPIDRKQNEIFDLFIANKANPNIDLGGASVLLYATSKKNTYAVKKLLDAGANPNKTNLGVSPLLVAIQKKQPEIVKLLVVAGADVNRKYIGSYPLCTSIQMKQPEISNILIDAGADINSKSAGLKPLDAAIYYRQPEVAQKLIDNGATVSSINYITIARNSVDERIRNLPVSTISAVKPTQKLQSKIVINNTINKKDPKLVIIQSSIPVSDSLYKQKLANDGKIYVQEKEKLTPEQYQVYRIAEKIIRANNLEYQNWRIGFDLNPEEINASSSAANLIMITSALYDSLHHNDDALALVISHEIAHAALGHAQETAENNYRIKELDIQTANLTAYANEQRQLSNINSALSNGGAALGNSIASAVYVRNANICQSTVNNIYQKERQMEFDADVEGVNFMLRAGYKVKKGLEAFEFMSNLPNLYTTRSTHPPMPLRISNVNSSLAYVNKPNLVAEGENNIYNSEVLVTNKSMDKKTIVINKPESSSKAFYHKQSEYEKYLNRAYIAYTTNDLNSAIFYFKQAYEQNPSDYLAPLYLSYSYESIYGTSKGKDSLKEAKRWIKVASKINSVDENVTKQMNDLKEISVKKKVKNPETAI